MNTITKDVLNTTLDILPNSVQRYLKYLYYELKGGEPELKLLPQLCDRQKLSLDVGANRGMYTLYLQSLSQEVICFEPNPNLSHYLEQLFTKQNVSVINCGLGDCHTQMELNIPYVGNRELHGWGSLRKDFQNSTWKEQEITDIKTFNIEINKLDDFQFKNVGFIKIDVEGFESQVIQGAMQTLKTNKPNLIIEIEQRHNEIQIEEIFQKILQLGYFGYFLFERKLHNLEIFNPASMQASENTDGRGQYICNFIFSPQPLN
ncbi:methyltransferase, FkbM family domain protein [Lyngbya aestuarii BL J]|uniref:Methyltransferase, FkbM family domain protein n=1 Tax=Lyngbya aestuarii BL J TaxID=1348334 RepID=U7QL88_9CYAN|nr:FkbM family methyltransferase [Lyngbya aestuarii]ERT08032.1 methyltransferase, FkbM family domain protein [Lyngbya aestuarii BL J]